MKCAESRNKINKLFTGRLFKIHKSCRVNNDIIINSGQPTSTTYFI